MADERYLVIAAACVVIDDEGKRHHLYYGAPVPEYVTGAQAERLLEGNFIGPVDVPILITPADGRDPIEIVPAAGAVPIALTDTGATVAPAGEPSRTPASGENTSGDGTPAGNAGAETWRDYHVRRLVAAGGDEGDARAEAESLGRDAIRARYLSA